ncbi:unnamed protein product [Eruca vesicaria subsp. sativa]|uniref:Uncharacterized protein n=1 Tax=Eruca vesicaria subsp. sativa TaxID=29727 RepID=A0ABC8JC30_ERUVS|nr:unnamed protein product [Eruca vesicaria subsp. sativa]
MSSKNSGAAPVTASAVNPTVSFQRKRMKKRCGRWRYQETGNFKPQKKMTVKEKVQQRLGFAEDVTKCLTQT